MKKSYCLLFLRNHQIYYTDLKAMDWIKQFIKNCFIRKISLTNIIKEAQNYYISNITRFQPEFSWKTHQPLFLYPVSIIMQVSV